jgi:AcrR family transcriptional regulator
VPTQKSVATSRATKAAQTASAAAPRPVRRTPASAKSEQRVQDILRVAREAFSERGYENVTTTEIAQRLGISEATVFTYFRGKRELCLRVIGDWYDEIIAAMEGGLPKDQPIAEQFAFIVRTHLRLFLIQGTGMCALVLSERPGSGGKSAELADTVVTYQRRYTAPLMDLLARGQASGDIRKDLPLRLLRPLVFGPMEHILWEAVATQKPADIDATAKALTEVLWQIVAAPNWELAALREFKQVVTQATNAV